MENPLHGRKLWTTVCSSNKRKQHWSGKVWSITGLPLTPVCTGALTCPVWLHSVVCAGHNNLPKSELSTRLLHCLCGTVQVGFSLADDSFILHWWISSWRGTRGTWIMQCWHWCIIMVATGTCWSLACSKPTTDRSSGRLGKVNRCLIFMVSTAKVHLWYSFRTLQCPLLR